LTRRKGFYKKYIRRVKKGSEYKLRRLLEVRRTWSLG